MEQARTEHAPNGSLLTYITIADAMVNNCHPQEDGNKKIMIRRRRYKEERKKKMKIRKRRSTYTEEMSPDVIYKPHYTHMAYSLLSDHGDLWLCIYCMNVEYFNKILFKPNTFCWTVT